MASFTPRLKKILKAHNCYFLRQGKGDHEFWSSPINGHKFPVDSNIVSRNMANVVLKQAGITDERIN